MYEQRILTSDIPNQYRNIPIERLNKLELKMKNRHNDLWDKKPIKLNYTQKVKLLVDSNNLRSGNVYYVEDHLCYLITNLKNSYWSQYVVVSENYIKYKIPLEHFELL
jgi:hypothetical protein